MSATIMPNIMTITREVTATGLGQSRGPEPENQLIEVIRAALM
jgi:hypothetical protein